MNEGASPSQHQQVTSKRNYCQTRSLMCFYIILKLMKQVVLGGAGQIFKMWWAFIGVKLPQRLVRKKCLPVSLKFHEIMHRRRRNRSSEAKNFLSADLTFDLWQQPIGNGRRYCKIQYNDTGTGSYPLPVEVPSPVLLGVGARSRCRCSRHSVIIIAAIEYAVPTVGVAGTSLKAKRVEPDQEPGILLVTSTGGLPSAAPMPGGIALLAPSMKGKCCEVETFNGYVQKKQNF